MSTRIDLLTPDFKWFDKPVATLYLRPPTASHLARFGELEIAVRLADGGSYSINQEQAIGQYIGALLSLDGENPVDGGGAALYSQLSLEDGLQVRAALFGFFTKAYERILERGRLKITSDS
jgi:hypothetical protein